MSGKRHRRGSGARTVSHRRPGSSRGQGGHPPNRTRGIIAFCVVLVVLGLLVWGLGRKNEAAPPEPPVIATADLDPDIAEQLENQLAAVRANPRSAKVWGRLGSLLKSLGYRSEAATCLETAARFDPTEPRWPYLLAASQAAGSTENALRWLRRTVALCGNEPAMPRLRLARLLAETGRGEEARGELRLLLDGRPDCGPAQLLLAQINQREGNWREARAWALRGATNPYTARTAWHLLAALYQRQGDTNAADHANRRAAAVTPDAAWPDPFEEELLAWRKDARSLSDRAQSLLVAGRTVDAWPLIQQLVNDHPDFNETWLLLGRAQFLQRKPAEAERSLRHYLAREPESVNGHFQLGMCLMARQQFAEAAATFRHATTLKSDFGPAYFNLGFALARSGQSRDAVPAFEEAIRHNPEHIDSYILLADLHVQLGETQRARELAGLAAGIDPDDRRLSALRDKIREAE